MSLNIEKNVTDVTTLVLNGCLDTTTAPDLEAALESAMPEANGLVLDMEHLEYLSSAGLRLLLMAQKTMAAKGGLTLTHVPEQVMEVLDITGFSEFLRIER